MTNVTTSSLVRQIPSFSQHHALAAWLCSPALARGRHGSSSLEREGMGPRHLRPPGLPSVTPPALHSTLGSAPAAHGHGLGIRQGGWAVTPFWFTQSLEAGSPWRPGGYLMLPGWRDAGGGVWFAVSSRSPASRSVAQPAATCGQKPAERQAEGGWGAGGRDLQVTTADIGEPCTFFQACPHLSSNHVPIASLGGRPTR